MRGDGHLRNADSVSAFNNTQLAQLTTTIVVGNQRAVFLVCRDEELVTSEDGAEVSVVSRRHGLDSRMRLSGKVDSRIR